MENDKVKAVKKQKTLTIIKEVESFLEFANFYKYFIKNFSHIAKSLNELIEKKKWKQKEEHQKAFKELKEKITSQPALTLPKREEKFRVEINTLGHFIREFYFRNKKENGN